MTSDSVHLSIVIDRPAADVYRYAVDPGNLPQWAAGLASTSVSRIDDKWVVDSPMGRVTVEFVAPNDLGVLDHVVTLPAGDRVYNPLRVIPLGEGSEVVFSLRRRPGMTAEQFEADAHAVQADLLALKRILEKR